MTCVVIPFKMARFTENAKPVIVAKELENHEADQLQKQFHEEQKNAVDNKSYIRRNMRTVHAIERAHKEARKKKSEVWEHRVGEIPVYLANRKKEAELDRIETLKQIE
jgi:hypothetical protein